MENLLLHVSVSSKRKIHDIAPDSVYNCTYSLYIKSITDYSYLFWVFFCFGIDMMNCFCVAQCYGLNKSGFRDGL